MRFILIISLLAVLFINSAKPDYVTANEVMVDRCTQAMINNPNFICD